MGGFALANLRQESCIWMLEQNLIHGLFSSLLDSLKTVLRFCKRKEKFISLFLAASLAVTEVIAPGPNQQEHGRAKKEKKYRKGWLILIHDISGTPVAAASMVTPFVPSHGTDHVNRSNPGAWLILRPGPCGGNSWFPLGRLEAWRERGRKGEISCKFKVMEEGGGFNGIGNTISLSRTVINCPKGNGDKVNINMELPIPGGFVMSVTTLNGEHDGKGKCSKLEVQLAMRHVACLEDAAVFMALAAAVDLSVDACQPFSRRLTKDLGLSCSLL